MNKEKVDNHITNTDDEVENSNEYSSDTNKKLKDEERGYQQIKVSHKKRKSGNKNAKLAFMDDAPINRPSTKNDIQNNKFLQQEGVIVHHQEFMNKIYNDVQMKHPYTVKGDKVKPVSLCSKAGGYCCCQCCRKSDLEVLGIGIVIYFKLMKTLMLSFFFIIILNAPLYFIYFSNHKEKKIKSYNDALYKTTIGNIGSTLYTCKSFALMPTLSQSSMNFDLECSSMVVSSIINFGTAVNDDEEQINKQNCFPFMSLSEVKTSSDCDLTEDLKAYFESSCDTTQSTCSLTVDMTALQSKCVTDGKISKIHLTYSCYESGVATGISELKLARSVFGFIVAAIDLICMLILILTLCCINSKQKVDYKNYTETNTSIREFTLHLRDVNIKKDDLNDEMSSLIDHFNQLLTDNQAQKLRLTDFHHCKILKEHKDYQNQITNYYSPNNYIVYEMIYPKLTCEKLDLIKKNQKLRKEVQKLEMQKNKLKQNAPANEKKIKKQELEIQKREQKMKMIQVEIAEKREIKEVKEFYITFRNHQIAKYLETNYSKSKCARCCMIGCCQKQKLRKFYYKGKWLKMSFAKDEPSNLKWENMTYSSCKRCLRKTFSIMMAIIVMLITLGIILLTKYFETQLSKDFNTSIDCSFFETTESDVVNEIEDTTKEPRERILTYCFCNNLITVTNILSNNITNATLKATNGTNINPCDEFFISYLKYNSVNLGLIVAIPIVNTIVIMIFRCLTSFERNKTLSKDMGSNMWKIFVIRFVNTGILLVIVNIKIDILVQKIPSFPFFAGSFKDFDPDWYGKVGVVILFSMLLDIITPHAASLFEVFMNYCGRCCDSGCSCGKKTKKLTKEDYFSTYTGPIFLIDARLASLLSSFYVTMIFSSGIPLLYVCFFLYLMFTFIFDKILSLRFYRNPPKYDIKVISNFIFFSFIGLIFHFGFSVWIYGNPHLLVDNAPNKLEIIKNLIDGVIKSSSGFTQNILGRMTLGHNLILILAFLGVLVILLFMLIITVFRLLCCNKEIQLGKKGSVEIGLAVKLRDMNKNYTIKQKEIDFLNKSKKDKKCKHLKANFEEGMEYDKSFITYKMEKILNAELPELYNNFDNEIGNYEQYFQKETIDPLKGESSYNIAFNPEFEAVAYYDYTKEV